MKSRGRPKKGYPNLVDLPDSFRMAMINFMAKFKISDLGEAYDRSAYFLNLNTEKFDKRVNEEAERRYRSRHMKEMNKARNTIYNNGYSFGYGAGLKEGEEKYKVWYYCSVCGKEIPIVPGSKVHEEAIDCLRTKGWGHKECHERGR